MSGIPTELVLTARKFDDSKSPFWSAVRFEVRSATRSRHTFVVRLEGEAAAWIAKEQAASAPRVGPAILRWAVRRIESLLQHPESMPPPKSPDLDCVELVLDDRELLVLRRLASEKNCDYQRVDGRDLLCSAAWRAGDTTIVDTQGHRALAPTSRALCLKCELPDTDMVCSRLHHPKVVGDAVSGLEHAPMTFRRQLKGAFCDVDYSELGTGGGCYPGGNSCWQRSISTDEPKAAVPYSPRDLPAALDFLNIVWTLAFPKTRLLQLKSAESAAGLTFSCSRREEFAARLSELADTLKLMYVPDALLPDADKNLKKDATLDRIAAALESRFAEYDGAGVEWAIGQLRAINKARKAFQHSGASGDLVGAMSKLGIEYPILDYGQAWDAIRSRAAESLSELRRAIQTALP